MGRLDQLDLTAQIGREEYEERLYKAQRKLLALRPRDGVFLRLLMPAESTQENRADIAIQPQFELDCNGCEELCGQS